MFNFTSAPKYPFDELFNSDCLRVRAATRKADPDVEVMPLGNGKLWWRCTFTVTSAPLLLPIRRARHASGWSICGWRRNDKPVSFLAKDDDAWFIVPMSAKAVWENINTALAVKREFPVDPLRAVLVLTGQEARLKDPVFITG